MSSFKNIFPIVFVAFFSIAFNPGAKFDFGQVMCIPTLVMMEGWVQDQRSLSQAWFLFKAMCRGFEDW